MEGLGPTLVNHPLASLVGPLRYACQRDFAHLSTVKDLKGLLERTLAGASGVDAEALKHLRAALPHVDHPAPERRKAALRRVVAGLKLSGVSLPTELAPLADNTPLPAGEAQGERAAVPPWKSTEPLPQAPQARPPESPKPPGPPRPTPLSLKLQSKPAPKAPGEQPEQKPARRKKKAATGQEESRAEAKLLSIAPRSGPLAIPLKTMGRKLGPRLISALNKKGLRRVGDVLFLLPRCYEDRRKLKTIAELIPGERGVTVGVVKMADFVPSRTGKRYFRAVVADRSGSIAATYFNAGPWLKQRFETGKRLILSGEVRASLQGREMAHPELEPAEDLDVTTSVHFNRIVPVYPGFERGDQRAFRDLAAHVSEHYAHHVEEPLPEGLRKRLKVMTLPEALKALHFPPGDSDPELLDRHLSPAHRRLAFDELFFLQLGMGLKR